MENKRSTTKERMHEVLMVLGVSASEFENRCGLAHGLLTEYIYSLNGKPRAQNMYLIAIKKIYTEAEKDYDIRPFSAFRLDIPRNPKPKSRALPIETIRSIFAWKGSGKIANIARDCAIISFCLCGTNSADLFNAPPIRSNTISYDRTKTKDRRADNAHIEIEIPKEIRRLVRKYKDASRAFVFHKQYSSPHSFNCALNIGLKKIKKELKLKSLSFYDFRHSWATIARNDLRIEKSIVHEALNHVEQDTAIDDIYIKKDYRLINDANKKVVELVFSTT